MYDYQKIIEQRFQFQHNLSSGQRVQNRCFKDRIGTLSRMVVVRVTGASIFGQCEVQWDNGKVTLEHPEHLAGLPMPGSKAA